MKKRFFIFLLAAAVLLGFAACRDPGTGAYVMNTRGELLGLTIANVTLEASELPASIHPDDWNDWDDFDLSTAASKTMEFQLVSDIVNVRIRPRTSANARTEWGIGDFITRPSVFTDVRVPASFNSRDYVYLRVTSEDTSEVNYYRFYAWVFNEVTHLGSVVVDDEKSIAPAAGGGTWREAEQGDLALTELQAPKTTIEAIGFDTTSTFKFARVPADGDGAAQPTVEPTNYIPAVDNKLVDFQFNDQDYLYIEVTAQNTVDKAYYKFLVSVGRITGVSELKLDELVVLGIGFSAATWGGVLTGTFEDADQPGDGYAIGITKEDPASTVEYIAIENAAAGMPTFPATSAPKIKFSDKQVLAIKVTSSNAKAIAYYKVQINLLAANFLIQPISTVYYYWVDESTRNTGFPVSIDHPERDTMSIPAAGETSFTSDTAVALYAVLDREITNGTYEWWEANSWYGGYGFDKNGMQSYIDDTIEEDDKQVIEEGFDVTDPYFDVFLDEKANASLFNGGNQEPAHYIVPGRKMEEHPAYGATYANISGTLSSADVSGGRTTVPGPIPRTDFRPFLASGSSESHYYWVVVTDKDTGLTVTSARASIVSERDKRKEHYVIDVNNYFNQGYNPLTDGAGKTNAEILANKISFKNKVPFKEQFDKYKIPLHFEADFDILKYSIMTAQARFFLMDGSPFIQNWTQGNLSFEKDGVIEVLYYNLTNNNAQYGLDGDSKEPMGADMRIIPTHIVTEPSGNNDQYFPPLRQPNAVEIEHNVNNGNMVINSPGFLQGWLCGFIDLVELRMEGPPRQPK